MILLVGLGNPGREYALTRHNAGYLALDHCAAQYNCSCLQEKWQGLSGRCLMEDRPVLLLKPQTFMNRSGVCVARFATYFNVSPAQLLVVHDDLDMPMGRVKVVARGGAGGHNGIRSLQEELATDTFARIKIGIGRPGSGTSSERIPVERYVLQPFSPDEYEQLQGRLKLVQEAVRLFVSQGIAVAMNQINAAGQGRAAPSNSTP